MKDPTVRKNWIERMMTFYALNWRRVKHKICIKLTYFIRIWNIHFFNCSKHWILQMPKLMCVNYILYYHFWRKWTKRQMIKKGHWVELRRNVDDVHSKYFLKYECFTKLYLARIIDFSFKFIIVLMRNFHQKILVIIWKNTHAI